MWEAVAIIIVAGGLVCWTMVRRRGQLAFWNRALRHPDVAYEFFKSSDVWQVFDTGLPADFRRYVPAGDWVGPFQMYVPKLGNQKVFVFGRKDRFRESQQALLETLNGLGEDAQRGGTP